VPAIQPLTEQSSKAPSIKPQTIQTDSQGWKAHLTLGFEKRSGKSILASRTQCGPLTVQRPFYPEGDVCHLYLLHPPGGVVGGDELHINVEAAKEANALITTPGATKFYRNTGKLAKQIQILTVLNDSSLEWFPQENIFFDGTHTQLTTRIELEESARFMGWEINCYGRPASKELFNNGKVDTKLEITRNGEPLLLDRLKIINNDALQSPASLAGYPCFGTFIATHVTPQLLEKAREAITDIGGDQQVGITLLDDILVARCLGQYAEQISTILKLIWMALRPEVMGRDACHPRIWAT
jgi:urease accessory protein